MKVKDLLKDLQYLNPNDDLFFETKDGEIHKVDCVAAASRVKFKELGSSSQSNVLIQEFSR